MPPAPLPPNESARLQALRAYGILDTDPEEAYDDLVNLAGELCEAPVAMVSFVDAERQWFKARVGLVPAESPRSAAICAHAILGEGLLHVPDLAEDGRFSDNPFVTGPGQARFYAGMPLVASDGSSVGTLCVIDRRPRQLSDAQRRALRVLGHQVEVQLELRLAVRELSAREAEVRAQRDTLARVQRQKDALTSLVVHDLKNPLASIVPNAKWLTSRESLPTAARDTAQDILTSSQQVFRLVLDLLDIGRSEDGELAPKPVEVTLAPLFEEIRKAATTRAADGGGTVVVDLSNAPQTAYADPDLLRRILDNLIDNALKYAPGGTVRLVASGGEKVWISVLDEGPGVPEAYRERIFERYAQIEARASEHAHTSRGLGLCFCRLAVEAHGGRIWVEPRAEGGSAFVVELPGAPG